MTQVSLPNQDNGFSKKGAAMIAFHGKPAVKSKYLGRVREHAKADEIIHGVGWERGKGCAVGCTLHRYDHSRYPIELGIPEPLAYLEDRIFEGLSNGTAQKFPAQFLNAITPGADLSGVLPRFLLALQVRRRKALAPVMVPIVGPAMDQVIAVLAAWWAKTGTPDQSAASAADAAWSAARSAADAAWSAAWSAADAAASAASAASAADAARSAEYEWQAATLLRLLRAAPMGKKRRAA